MLQYKKRCLNGVALNVMSNETLRLHQEKNGEQTSDPRGLLLRKRPNAGKAEMPIAFLQANNAANEN